MKLPTSLKHLAIVALAMAWLHGDASASTLYWYSEFDAQLITSQQGSSPGDPTVSMDSSFIFELGTFGFFIPTESNIDQWAANWKILDRATLEIVVDPDTGYEARFFTTGGVTFDAGGNGISESDFADPAVSFTQGEQIFLWAYNSKDIVVGSEWALVRDGGSPGLSGNPWVIPDPVEPASTSYELDLQYADQVVFGGANNVRGPGEYGDNQPANFRLQTATVVPEPGSSLLLFAAGVAFVVRRTSRRMSRSTLA